MVQLSLSADTNIRSQLMAQIRAITNSNLLDISDKVKQILCERARDKIVRTRIDSPEPTRLFVLVGSSQRSARLPRTRVQKGMCQCPVVGSDSETTDLGRQLYHSLVLPESNAGQVR